MDPLPPHVRHARSVRRDDVQWRVQSHEVVGAQIPDPLILGPDPQAAEPDLAQVDGDLLMSESLAWLHDFDAALRAGMAVRIPITGDEAEVGFDRVVALGLRLSADPRGIRRRSSAS